VPIVFFGVTNPVSADFIESLAQCDRTRLETLGTPEDESIPPSTLAALKRDLERHRTDRGCRA
jgi:hypothetical protein